MRVGSRIASGRDCHIFEAGGGKVVRRARDGRSLEREASVMRHARRNGFPAPEVFDADGPDILMERVNGPNLMQDAAGRPWLLRSYARLLAELLGRLATVPAPGWLPAVRGCLGNRLLHLDLHPLNVLVTADGPLVIDWANAGRGAPGADVANTWLTMATAVTTGPVLGRRRRLMLRTFLDGVDRQAARRYLGAMAERRSADRYVSDTERAAIDRLVARETNGHG